MGADQRQPGTPAPAERRRGGSEAEPSSRIHQILAATRAAMLKRGVDDVRVADIAQEASVSTGAVHYHFDAKDDVLLAAFRWSANQLFAEVEARLEAQADAPRKLACLLEMCVPVEGLMRDEWVIWIQFWARVLNHRSLLPECERVSERWRRYFAEVVEEGVAQGQFSPERPLGDVIDWLIAMVDGVGFETVVGYRWTSPGRMRELVRGFAEQQLRTRLPELDRQAVPAVDDDPRGAPGAGGRG